MKKIIREEDTRRYILTNVTSCTFSFSDGTKNKVDISPDWDIVMIEVMPHISGVKALEAAILRNYPTVKDMHDLALKCGYNCLKTFSRHFKRCFGQTPYQWFLEKKMEEISLMLLQSDTSITRIAELYGFAGPAHLVTAFRKMYGITPKKYRLLNAPDKATMEKQ